MLLWLAAYWNRINTTCREKIILHIEYKGCGGYLKLDITDIYN